MKNRKLIFHIDFDSYFVSAHRSTNIFLKHKPVAVSHKPSNSIVSSISYELKNKKVKVGTPKYLVERVEPDTIFVEPDFNLYITLSNKIFEYIAKVFSKNIEVYSIDECWLDVTEETKDLNVFAFAREIQQKILFEYDIPVSIGISHTKWLAKMATGLKKPFGINYIDTFEDVKNTIYPLPIEEYFGIGKSLAAKLKKVGINTIGDLATSSLTNPDLYKIFRSRLKSYIDDPNGEGSDKLTYEHNELKGIGNEVTFSAGTLDNRHDIYATLKMLANKVALRAQNRTKVAKTISIVVRSVEKAWKSKQHILEMPTNDEAVIYDKAVDLFESVWKEEPIKGIGIRLTNLISEFDVFRQLTIFEDDLPQQPSKNKVDNIIDKVNKKLHKKALKTGYQVLRENTAKGIQSRYIQDDLKKS